MRRTIGLSAAALAIALAGCDRRAESAAPAPQPVGDLLETMNWVLDPAADAIWDGAGFVITAAGEESLAPTAEEGWAAVRHGAAVVAEGGNLLLMPHLLPAADEGPGIDAWVEYARGMTRIAEQALAAVDAQDAEALFEVGGHLYNVCLACHQAYARPEDGDP